MKKKKRKKPDIYILIKNNGGKDFPIRRLIYYLKLCEPGSVLKPAYAIRLTANK